MRVRMTETAIAKAIRDAKESKGRVELADELLPGLRLRVSATGLKVWLLGVRDADGKPRRFPLGRHPVMGISEARDAARALHQSVFKGSDPIAERRRVRNVAGAAARGEGTLRAVLDAYQAPGGAAPLSWAKARPTVERVFAKHLDRPAERLTLDELLLAADAYPARPSAGFATRSLRPALKWAAPRKLVPAELVLLQRRDPVRRRVRVLSHDELGRVLRALRASERPHAAALRLMVLTLARREEVCGASWGEIDLEAADWTIPAQRTKNGQAHSVPLSRQVVDQLRALRPSDAQSGHLVFSVKGRTKEGEVTRSPIGNWDRETKVFHSASRTEGWHRHDLRRTGATLLGDLGELPDIIEAALNHVSIRSPLAATYNRSRYRPQVAVALQRLADMLDAITAG